MTFGPSETTATSVVLAQRTAGGEDWQLVASRAKGGLSIEIVAETTGTGVGAPDGSNVIDANALNSASRSSSLASGENPTRASNVRPAAIHRARRNSQSG